ncbi:MAG: cell surface protein [Verrucomicrobia bacterium]|jgi:outer membrane protein assembly factor BamB|nr:cell surface protein [Verrucomicrobiota bacterium]
MKFLWRISILLLLVITLSPAAKAAPGDVKWTYTGHILISDLALNRDGTIYITSATTPTTTEIPLPSGGYMIVTSPGSETNDLIALHPDGQVKWQKPNVGQHIAVLSSGRVLVTHNLLYTAVTPLASGGTITSVVRSIDRSTGFEPNGDVWQESVLNGRVAITANDDIIALNHGPAESPADQNMIVRTGNAGWQSPPLEYLASFPVIGPDGTIYAVTDRTVGHFNTVALPSGMSLIAPSPTNRIHALTSSGTPKYGLENTNLFLYPPVFGNEGSLFVSCLETKTNGDGVTYNEASVRSLSAGLQSERWRKTGTSRFGPIVVGTNNHIYTGNTSGLYALDDTGAERWFFPTTYEVNLSPALAADGTVYFVSADTLWAVDAEDGTLRWSYKTTGTIKTAPTIGPDGTIHLLLSDTVFLSDTLLALEGTAPPANAPWPQDRHDAQRTSRATQASAGGLSRNVDGKFSLSLNLEPGRAYKVEASEDFQTWTEIGSFNSNSAAQTFLDETSAGKPQRFYRLALP